MRFKLFLLLLFSWCLSSDMALADVRKGDVTFKSIKTDSIEEDTTGAGVTIAGATVKDGGINGIFSGPGSVPIGGMVAVMPATHANAWQPPADCTTVKEGFVKAGHGGLACTVPVSCTDCVIPGGTVLPLMNNDSYPRGGDTSGGTGGANTQESNVTVASFTNPYVPGHYHSNGTGSNAATSLGVTGGTCSGTFAAHTHTHNMQHIHQFMYRADFGNYSIYYSENNPNNAYNQTSYSPSDPTFLSASTYSTSSLDRPAQELAATPSDNWYTTNTINASAGSSPNTGTDSNWANVSSTAAALTGSNTVTGNFGLVDGGSNGNASFATTGGAVSLDNNAVNNEPKYVSVVWVIRVK